MRALLADRRVRYVAVGCLAAAVYYGLFSAGYLLAGHRISASAGFSADVIAVFANLATAVLTFPLYRVAVFGGDGPWIQGFLRFYVIAFWSLLWSLVGLPLLIDVVGLPVLLAQAIIVVAVPLLNYQIHIFWTFRRRS
ncbi:MAG TPA: GtrA family protein [Micromonosporaceae bacterium]|nr:GtrA family protein [Micromonosporaceae bacterium]